MALDLYVGSLSRYFARTWKTMGQQAAEQAGLEFEVIGLPAEGVQDPEQVRAIVTGWRDQVVAALRAPVGWDEDVSAPYWTDRIGWDGFEAVVLQAAYVAHPELVPADPEAESRAGLSASAAYAASFDAPGAFPSLLRRAVWWLPVQGPQVFDIPDPSGNKITMSTVEQLGRELDALAEAKGWTSTVLSDALAAGQPEDAAPVEQRATFAAVQWKALAENAAAAVQPLVMDY